MIVPLSKMIILHLKGRGLKASVLHSGSQPNENIQKLSTSTAEPKFSEPFSTIF